MGSGLWLCQCCILLGLLVLGFNSAYCLPDLVIDEIDVEPGIPVEGHQATLMATVRNAGTTKTGSGFTCQFNIDGQFLGSVQMGVLAPGETSMASTKWVPSLGSPVVGFFADINQAIGEIDEGNNYGQKTLVVEGENPDLVVESIRWTPAEPSRGETIEVKVVIKNAGYRQVTSTFQGRLVIDGVPRPINIFSPPLAVGETREVRTDWVPTRSGVHKLEYRVDLSYDVSEISDQNNHAHEFVNVTDPAYPDLYVKEVNWTPLHAINGSVVEVNITVANGGNSTAEAPFTGILSSYSGEVSTVEYNSSIGPNQTYTVALAFLACIQEFSQMSFFVDPEFVVDEWDTGNNGYLFDLLVFEPSSLPDLMITDVWVHGPNLRFQVMNRGNQTAPEFQVGLELEGQYTSNTEIGELAPGDRCYGTFQGLFDCQGKSTEVSVLADSRSVVPELDESNNRRTENWKCDTDPPRILGSPGFQLNPTSTRITWTTDEKSDSTVVMDEKIPLGSISKSNSSLVTEHSIQVKGLNPSTVYAFYVESSDDAGNSVRSETFTLITPPTYDSSPPKIHGYHKTEAGGHPLFRLNASDDSGIRRVEFRANGALLGTDYSSPYEIPLDEEESTEGMMNITATVFDLFGNSREMKMSIEVGNFLPRDGSPLIVILNPREGDTVSGELEVRVLANDPDGFDFLEIFFDSDAIFRVSGTPTTLIGFEGATPEIEKGDLEAEDSFNITYRLDTLAWDNGPHTLRVAGSDIYGNSTEWIINLTVFNPVPRRHPELIFSRPDQELISRPGMGPVAGLVAVLEVRNAGEAPAINVTIEDTLHGFYPTGSFYTIPASDAAFSTRLYRSIGIGAAVMKFPEIPAGQSIIIKYAVIPILREGSGDHRNIGASVIIDYNGSQGDTYSEIICLTAASVTVEMESPPFHWSRGEMIDLEDAVESCIHTSDYLIVTCPPNLFFAGGTDEDHSKLMESMSRLAWLKKGVIGFLSAESPPIMRENLCRLIWEGGEWSGQMAPGYSSDGYLLIVGEGEVVPSFHHGRFNIEWSGDHRKDVDYCDTDYGDSNGNWKPEIMVGRIIGDDANTMRRPIQASIDVEQEEAEYGRDKALLISGYGAHYRDFVSNVNDIYTLLHPLSDPPYSLVIREYMDDYFYLRRFSHTYTRYDGLAIGDVTGGGNLITLVKDDDHTLYAYNNFGSLVATHDCPSFDAHCILRAVPVAGADMLAILDPHEDVIWIRDLPGSSIDDIPITPVSGHVDFDVGDIDGDGQVDYVVASARSDRVYLYEPGSPESSFPFDFTDHDRLAVGNVIGDAKEEIVIARNDDNSLFIMDGAGGVLTTISSPDRTYFTRHDRMAIGDVCGGVMEEIVVAMNDDGIVRAYNSTGHQRAWVDLGFTRRDQLALGDLRGDPKEEIVIARDDDSWVLIGDMYWANRIRRELGSSSQGTDVIMFNGHGNINNWNCYRTGDLPPDFGSGVPFVLAVTCLSGNYEEGTIAEGFLGKGAAVYIGSTMVSPTNINSWVGERFFENWVDTGRDLGQAFRKTERDVRNHFHGRRHGEFGDYWVAEYNFYGDPKFGAIPSTGSMASLAGGSGPPSEVIIDVPELQVEYDDGNHVLSIPGGTPNMEAGMPQLPVYTCTIPIPHQWIVNKVALESKREGLRLEGIELPPALVTNGSIALGSDPGSDYPEGIYPAVDFEWEVFEEHGNSRSLALTVFPVRYDMLTANLTFWDQFVFAINSSPKSVFLSDIEFDLVDQGEEETLWVEVEIDSIGEREIILGGTVGPLGTGNRTGGFKLQNLEVSGKTFARMELELPEMESGGYMAEIMVMDLQGRVLDLRGARFWVGEWPVNVTGLEVTDDIPPGACLNATIGIENSGEVQLNGTARLWVLDDMGRETDIMTEQEVGIMPGELVLFNRSLDIGRLGEGRYFLAGCVSTRGRPSRHVYGEFLVAEEPLVVALAVLLLLAGRVYRVIW